MPNREVFRLGGPLKVSKAGGGGAETQVLGVGPKGMRATDPVGPLPGSLLLLPPRGPLAHLLHYISLALSASGTLSPRLGQDSRLMHPYPGTQGGVRNDRG